MNIKIIYAAPMRDSNVFLKIKISDGENSNIRKLILDESEWVKSGLKNGSELGCDEFDRLEKISDSGRAMRKALEILSYGANSQAVLKKKLCQRGFDPETVQSTVDEIMEKHLINQNADAQGIVRMCIGRGYGKNRISAKLRERGYDSGIIAEAMRDLENTDFSFNCAKMINKKYPHLPDDRHGTELLIAAMVRYGYSYGEIRRALEICRGN